MSVPVMFFAALGLFILFVCLLGLFYGGGADQLLDFSADRVAERRAGADALDLQSLIEATNRNAGADGRPPLSDEELRRAFAESPTRGPKMPPLGE
jgi:hypothetical protein